VRGTSLGAYLVVIIAARIGGASRHAVNVAAARLLGTSFRWGTLSVNVLGGVCHGLARRLAGADGRTDVDTARAPVPRHRHSRRLHDLSRLLARHNLLLGAPSAWSRGGLYLTSVVLSIAGLVGGVALVRIAT
jgi:hypothetical protein